VSLRWRIAIGFALVALATAAVVVLATPPIVGQGFAELDEAGELASPVSTPLTTQAGATAPGDDDNEGGGQGQPAQTAPSASSQAQQSTTFRLIIAAALAALAASLLGLFGASQLVRPLGRLERAAAALARGDLAQRSGLADRSDEFGQLGRTFDAMAGELQRADETRRGFLQDAAHELKTPLAVIDATSSAILDGVYAPEQKHIATIRDQSRILARIVDDLRTISLAEGGHLPLERRPVELATALLSVAAGFEARAETQGTTLAVAAPAGLVAEADPDRVRQMAAALVDNALRHTPAGGTVRLVAAAAPAADTGSGTRSGPRRAPRAAIRVSIEDTGSGIPPDVLPRIFERFFQADPSHSRGTSTSGLGLSIVKALAEAQGGRAGAENMASGGARLWFELPSR
jgi:two-component system sensor histidine kinase BaeS